MRPICLIAGLAASLVAVEAAEVVPAEIPFEYQEGLLWIRATIADPTNQVNLLLDTGAGASVINRSTAERLGLKLGAAVNVRGVCANLTGYTLKNVSARCADILLPSVYLAVDLSKFSRSCERPVDGLVGADFFRGRVVQLDFKEHKLRILKPGQLAISGETLPIQVRPCGMRVPITVNGQTHQWVRLDTGCATSLQWVTSRVKATDCNPKVAIGLAKISVPQTQTSVEVGHQKFENVPTGLHEQAIFAGEAGILGNGLLSCFSSITIDAKAGRLILSEARRSVER